MSRFYFIPNRLFIVLLMAALLLIVPLAVSAQTDVPVEPTDAPPVEVPPEPTFINTENGISISTIAYGVIIALLSGGTLAVILTRFGSSQANLDAMEKLFLSTSPDTQEMIRERFVELEGFVKTLLEIADKVTDGAPNTDMPQLSTAEIQAIVRREINVGAPKPPPGYPPGALNHEQS